MTDQNPPQEETLEAEFRALGDNLKQMLQAAWERPERQQLQTEIERGLHELGDSLRQASNEFTQSDVGQKVKSGVEDIRTRVESGDVEKNIRKDLSKAMQTVNAELQKLVEKLRAASASHQENTGDEQ